MRTLIIKLGALGDVVRTTSLLRALEGEVDWVTQRSAAPLLPTDRISGVYFIDDCNKVLSKKYDLVLSLDDELQPARLASNVNASRLSGAYANKSDVIRYTNSASSWFDLGIISRHGIQKADQLKLINRRSYQDMLFELAGLEFQGEEYWINIMGEKSSFYKQRIGLEHRSGDRWPTKRWDKYTDMAFMLEKNGMEPFVFEQRARITDYIRDIASCRAIVCGDTLCMHLALALGKPVVSIFTCTSPWEIYDYGRMTKLVSPYLEDCFYQKEYYEQAPAAISVEQVCEALQSVMSKTQPNEL